MRRHPAFIAPTVLLLACASGGEGTPPSDVERSGAPQPSASAPSSPSPSPSATPSGGSSAGPPPTPLVSLRNTSSTPRWVATDYQGVPVDFEIGQPPLKLNGYGGEWCDGPKGDHNDPAMRVVRLDPGVAVPVYWHLMSVTLDGRCWRGTPLPAGSYPTKACFYEAQPDGRIVLPGEHAATIPLVCAATSLVVPALPAKELTLDF